MEAEDGGRTDEEKSAGFVELRSYENVCTSKNVSVVQNIYILIHHPRANGCGHEVERNVTYVVSA